MLLTSAPISYTAIPVAHAEVIPYDLDSRIGFFASKWGVNETHMSKVIQCESQGSTTLQSLAIDPKTGIREDSWGIAQWNLPANNKTFDDATITKAMALDPDIALDNMAYYWSKGLAYRWTCYKSIYGK